MAEDEVVKAISTVMDALSPLDPEAREHVLEFVVKRLGMSVLKPPAAAHVIPGHMPPPPAPPTGGTDIRSFAALKAPKTLNEKVAVMAFFLSQMAGPDERRDYITSEDIKPYFIQADFELPTGPANMTLPTPRMPGI